MTVPLPRGSIAARRADSRPARLGRVRALPRGTVRGSAAWHLRVEAAWLPTPSRCVPASAERDPAAVPAERVPEVLANTRGGFRELENKVAEKGQSLADDIARVAAARDALPNAR